MIDIKVEKAHGDYDYGTSKFLGAPTMPEEWLSDGTLSDDDFFFCQIKLSELREHTSCTLLPPKGFLYIFLFAIFYIFRLSTYHTGCSIYRGRYSANSVTETHCESGKITEK